VLFTFLLINDFMTIEEILMIVLNDSNVQQCSYSHDEDKFTMIKSCWKDSGTGMVLWVEVCRLP